MSRFVILNLDSCQLMTHPLPSGRMGAICFDSPEAVEEYTAQQPKGPYKAIRLTTGEYKSIPQKIGW